MCWACDGHCTNISHPVLHLVYYVSPFKLDSDSYNVVSPYKKHN